jgi:hypothetical protein
VCRKFRWHRCPLKTGARINFSLSLLLATREKDDYFSAVPPLRGAFSNSIIRPNNLFPSDTFNFQTVKLISSHFVSFLELFYITAANVFLLSFLLGRAGAGLFHIGSRPTWRAKVFQQRCRFPLFSSFYCYLFSTQKEAKEVRYGVRVCQR